MFSRRLLPSLALVTVTALALPGALLAQHDSWEPYKFRGTEHFKYDVQTTENNQTITGFYTLDFAKQPNDRVKLKVAGTLGDNSAEFSTTAPLDDVYGQAVVQLMMSPVGAPLFATLFAPFWTIYFAGQSWDVGSGWSFSQGDESLSFKIESTCSQAGVAGKKVVWREGGEVRSESCVAPNVALPLAVMLRSEQGEVFRLTLTEYRP